jgi:acyl-CoA thioester hydrolase
MEQGWFAYPLVVQPHHTDYAGIVWHGTYIAWMEEARVACLRSQNASFTDWLAAEVDLPVVDLALKYRQPLGLGDEALVKVRLLPLQGVRLIWEYDIQNRHTGNSCVGAQVTLAPVHVKTRKVLRRLPLPLMEDLQGIIAGPPSSPIIDRSI